MKKTLIIILTILIATPFVFFLNHAYHRSSKQKLYLLIWSDYIKTDLIEEFRIQHDCEMIIDTYDSNESMYAKLKFGSGNYDIVIPSGYFMEMMNEQGMLTPIDHSRLPNLKNLDPEYINPIAPELLKIGVPYMISIAGVAYRKDKVSEIEDSWDVFNDSKYRGRMTMLNDVRETIGAALIFLGYSVNSVDPDEIDHAVETIIQWKRNLAKFESEQYKSGIASGEFLVVSGYNGDTLQVIQENPNVDFFFPREGTAIAIDFLTIPKEAPNPELAYALIDYLLDGSVAAENMKTTFFFTPNLAAYDLLPEELKTNPLLFIPEKIRKKATLIRYQGKKGIIYNKAWNKIKGA